MRPLDQELIMRDGGSCQLHSVQLQLSQSKGVSLVMAVWVIAGGKNLPGSGRRGREREGVGVSQ